MPRRHRHSETEDPGTLLPFLALPYLSTPQSDAETTSLPTSVSLLGISLAVLRDLLSGAYRR